MNLYKMSCGHVSNSTIDGNPYCAICDCRTIEKEIEDTEGLEGRVAICPYCHKRIPSNWKLPFFKYNPDKDTDEYYCGCFGWD